METKQVMLDICSAIKDAISELDFEKWKEKPFKGAYGLPTSRLDKVAEDAALEVLAEFGNPWNVLTEEAGYIDQAREKVIVIDPIDGTHNAYSGIPAYTVSLAIGTKTLADVEAGMVYNLPDGSVFYAEKDAGAYLNNQKINVRKYEDGRGLFSVYLGNLSSDKTFEITRLARRVRHLGAASLDICMVARGAADLYMVDVRDVGHSLRIVDIAASILILREAGGEAYDIAGNVLDIYLDLEARANIIAVGDNALLEKVKNARE